MKEINPNPVGRPWPITSCGYQTLAERTREANVPKAEHRAQRSEHGAQLVAARYWLWATAAEVFILLQAFIVAFSQ